MGLLVGRRIQGLKRLYSSRAVQERLGLHTLHPSLYFLGALMIRLHLLVPLRTPSRFRLVGPLLEQLSPKGFDLLLHPGVGPCGIQAVDIVALAWGTR